MFGSYKKYILLKRCLHDIFNTSMWCIHDSTQRPSTACSTFGLYGSWDFFRLCMTKSRLNEIR